MQTFCVLLVTLPIVPVFIFWLDKDSRYIFYDLKVIFGFFFFLLFASLWLSWVAWRKQGVERKQSLFYKF